MTAADSKHSHLREEASTDALPLAPALGASLDAARMPRQSTLVERRVLLISAVETRDYPVIMGATLVIGACVILVNILTDLAYAVVDPRIKVA